MSFQRWVSDAVEVIEAVGAGALVVGGVAASFQYAADVVARRGGSYQRFRRSLGRVIQVGLEVLIVADIIRTIIVAPTLSSVAALGGIVLIRIALSWSLEVEIDGSWPWRRAVVPPTDR